MLNFRIPLEFVRGRVSLTWPEVKYGIDQGWLTGDDAIELAMREVSTQTRPSADVLSLASITSRDRGRARELVERLAASHDEQQNGKWLYVLLAWLYSSRMQFRDPFQIVEEIYASFDYPEEIVTFVRYMPAEDPGRADEHSMLDAWRNYLDRQEAIYGRPSEQDRCR